MSSRPPQRIRRGGKGSMQLYEISISRQDALDLIFKCHSVKIFAVAGDFYFSLRCGEIFSLFLPDQIVIGFYPISVQSDHLFIGRCGRASFTLNSPLKGQVTQFINIRFVVHLGDGLKIPFQEKKRISDGN
jgi:hypothetical protein